MQKVKNVRTSDRISDFDTKESGFVVRKHTPIQAIVRLLMMITGIMAGTAVLLYYNDIDGVLLALGVGSAIAYIGRKLEHQETLQRSSEFMNALFSSALGDGYKFCAVARRAGEIVYVNRAFQDVFPTFIEQPKRDLKTLVRLFNIPEEDGQKMMLLATDGALGTVHTSVSVGVDRRSEPLSISVCPISRPHGFVLLRGKN